MLDERYKNAIYLVNIEGLFIYDVIQNVNFYLNEREGGEYKFFEDEKYEYYYPTQKTQVVQVYFKNGDIITAEETLKQGKISMDLLDKYEIEYFKKEK